ncbi:hypothetical protein LTR36_010377 [Oleoguttula mirabilis]|uniref:Uncharacterized protein n=1 Tax=Oleoguttula mirabilis TaxID=1507867 RepID=A0AAV9J4D2_9PEZI|nr:hypothetical protein LTR36_010377 [Oleoguttula mirabilis]
MFALSAQALSKHSCAEECEQGQQCAQFMGRHAQVFFDLAFARMRHGIEGKGEDEEGMDGVAKGKAWECLYLTSVLLSVYALVKLSETPATDDKVPNASHAALLLWLRLSTDTQTAYHNWNLPSDRSKATQTALHPYGTTLTPSEDSLYHSEQGHPFTQLLTFASGSETTTPEAAQVYEKVLSHITYTFKLSNPGTHTPPQRTQHLLALPSRLPPRFTTLIATKQP